MSIGSLSPVQPLVDGATAALGPRAHRSPQAYDTGTRLEHALRARLEVGSPLTGSDSATVVFDAGVTAWTLALRGPHMELRPGRATRPTTTILSDVETLTAIAEGSRSGIDAFLSGHLWIRGNMALALELDGFDHPAKPIGLPRAKRTSALGVDTFYLEAGEGPPVVLLHGLGATNASMLPTLAALSHDHRVLAPDLPGFGNSSKPVRRYDAAFFARWLAAFLDTLGITRAHLVGNSMGGRVAIEAALSTPERVDRLVLYAPAMAFKRMRTFTPIVRLLAAEMAALPILIPRSSVLRGLRALFHTHERVPPPWHEAAVDEFLRVFATVRGRIAFFSAARQLYLDQPHGAGGFWERLPYLSRPALFLWGDADRLVPARFASHVAAAVPRARSIILEDCGHVPQFEHPERTHRLARDFLGVARGS